MKKLNKLMAVLLSLTLCLGMVAPAFAASFDDLQDAIDADLSDSVEPSTPEAPSVDEAPVEPSIPQNGDWVSTDDSGNDHYGFGWSQGDDNKWNHGIEAWNDADGNRNVELKGDVTHEETDETGTIVVDANDGKVNIDLNDHNITGNGEDTVIKVEQDGDLTITGEDDAAPSASPAAEEEPTADEPKNTISNQGTGDGIDVAGDLKLDGVTITGTDTAVNVGKDGTAEIEDSTITGNNTGVAFVDDSSVTFTGTQNVVNDNKTKNVDGTGKVEFKLGDTTYKVDAETAETLLAVKDSIAAYGENWILAKNGGEETYTVVYTGAGTAILDSNVNSAISGAKSVANCEESSITGFVVPNEVTIVGNFAFRKHANLKKVTMHGVTSIGIWAFEGCKALEAVELSPSGATSVGDWAFAHCTALKTIDLASNTEIIKGAAFMGCTNLNLDFSKFTHLKEIGNNAFQATGVSGDIVFPESLETIGNDAFRECKGLTGLDLSKSKVTALNQFAFQNCSRLTTIKLPNNLTSIGNYVFQGCTGLTGEIEIPANVTGIGQAAFNKCNITGVKFAEGSKLKTIGGNAFWDCFNLKRITLPEGLTRIDSGALFRVTTVVFPSTLTDVAEGAFYPGNTRCAILYSSEGMDEEDIATAVEQMKKATTRTDKNNATNIYVVNDSESLEFYRENVSAAFDHNNADGVVNLDDGSIELTNVSGTITVGENEVSLPDVAGVSVSIDTDGNITVNAPITVGDESYPYGATIAPDGTVTALPAPPVYDDYTDPTEVEVDDPAVPLAAGPVTRAQFVDYLWRHEGEPEGADCTFADVPADHEYVLALGWAEANGIAAADADGNFQPDELVTVEAVRAILGSFTNVFGTNAVAVADLTTLTGDDGEAVLNCDQVLAEFFGEEYILPEDLDILEPDDAA